MTDWIDSLKKLEAARAHLSAKGGIMTAYERDEAQTALREMRERERPAIVAGAVGMMRESLEAVQAAQQGVLEARQAEERRWDAGKLTAEAAQAKAQVEKALAVGNANPFTGESVSSRLQTVWDQAKLGDTYRQRAYCEAIEGIVAVVPSGDRQAVSAVQYAAKRLLQELRDTDEIVAARTKAREAFEVAAVEVKYLDRTSQIVDGHGVRDQWVQTELSREARRLSVDPLAGTVSVLAEDDPRVTGFELVWPGSPADALEAAGG